MGRKVDAQCLTGHRSVLSLESCLDATVRGRCSVSARVDVVVRFWLRPGEAAVTLGEGEEKEVERIPEQLRRFL